MSDDAQVQLGSPERFGHSWNIFSEILPVHEEQFLRWTSGVEQADCVGKQFLDFSKMPLSLVYFLSLPATALLWLVLHAGLGKTEYMRLIRTFSFRHLRAIVYDHMLPRIAKYFRKQDAIGLLQDAGLEDVQAHWVNEMSWTVIGIKPQTSGQIDPTDACAE